MKASLALVVALTCAWLVVGCASGGGMESGIRIGDKTLEQFKAGKTSESWVLAILGPPTTSSVVGDEPDVKVLRYSMLQRESPGLVASWLGSTAERNVATVYFVIRKGVVERFWADRDEGGGLFKRTDHSGEKTDE